MDTSDAAIEADLELAERNVSRGEIALVRAQVRATLRLAATTAGTVPVIPAEPEAIRPPFARLPRADDAPDIQIAVGPFGDSYAVPEAARWEDRVTAAARLLRLTVPALDAVLLDLVAPKGPDLVAPAEADAALDLDIEDDADVDADFFAEAKAQRRKR